MPQTLETKRSAQAAHRRRQRDLTNALKDVPCFDCGGSFPIVCMDFDHRDPAEKSFTVSGKIGGSSLTRLLAEIAKCDVVCSNCHRIRTAKMQKWGAA